MKSLANAGDRAGIHARLQDLRPDSPRRWGRMSAHQMICHLADTFRFALGDIEVRPAAGTLQRIVFKPMALWVPLPWPKGVPTRPEMDQMIGGTPPDRFERDADEVLTLMDRFCSHDRFTAAHPIFGPMTQREWMRWAWLHMDHHLRQFGV